MKNKFIAILVGMLLCITSCRTDETLNQEKRTSTEKIAVFEKFEKLHSEELLTKKQLPALQLSYGEPFAELIKNFLMKHPDYEKQINEAVGEIRMDVVSQTIGKEEKTLIFPVTDSKGTVTAAWLGTVNKNRDYVKFYCLNNASKEVQSIIGDFQKYYDRVPGRSQKIKEKEIEEVVITIINPYPSSDMPWWVFDYNPSVGAGGGDGLGSGMDGGYQEHARGEGSYNNTDPCAKAKTASATATTNSKNTTFTNAKTSISGMNNNKENGVVFGNVNGATQSTGLQTGGEHSITLTHSFSNPTGDLHNHTDNTPPSPGDVYSLINARNSFTNYNTRYVTTPDGTIYALVVTDTDAMNTFLQNYPPYQANPNMSPNFPQSIFYEWANLKNTFSESGALAFILNKYNSGITLTKMDGAGNFRAVNITTTQNADGTTIYKYDLCPN